MSQRPWVNLSLRARFLASVLLIVICAIGISGVIFYAASARAIERRAFASAEDLAAQMSTNVDQYIRDIEGFSRVVLGDGIILRKMDRSVLQALGFAEPSDGEVAYEMLTLLLPQKSLQGMYIFAQDGKVYSRTHGKTPRLGYTVEQEPWYGVLRADPQTPFALWPTGDETTVFQDPVKVFSLVRPITYKLGQNLGYLKIDVKPAGFAGFLLASNNAGDDQILILADDGRVIYDNTGRLTGERIDSLRPIEQDSWHGRLEWRGIDSIYSAQRSPYTSWTTWLILPARSINAGLRQTALAVFVVCIGVLALMALGLYVLTGGVTRPIRALTGAMRRVEEGDLAVRMPRVETNDEVGRLSRGFNTMLDSLERLITQVLRAELREKDAQLLALQAQINPHFLYNTLNSIRALSRRNESAGAADTIDSLTGMLRYSISDWDKPALLRDELAHVRNYADIQKVRFGDAFSIKYEVPPELLDARVIKLSLQPLVENALTHGRDSARRALCVTVSARRRGSLLELQVIDDGAGMDEQSLLKLRQRLADTSHGPDLPTVASGIGVVNIDRRGKLLFGGEYGLSIESASGKGVTATLRLPYVDGAGGPAEEGLHDEHRRR